jgi:hypothetical protein
VSNAWEASSAVINDAEPSHQRWHPIETTQWRAAKQRVVFAGYVWTQLGESGNERHAASASVPTAATTTQKAIIHHYILCWWLKSESSSRLN